MGRVNLLNQAISKENLMERLPKAEDIDQEEIISKFCVVATAPQQIFVTKLNPSTYGRMRESAEELLGAFQR